MSVFLYILTFIQNSKSSVLTDCSEWDSEIILSECRIVGALEGTRLELGVRLVYTTAIYLMVQHSSKNYRCWSVKSLETRTNASKPWASLPHSRNTCCKFHLYRVKGWDHVATRCVCVPGLQLASSSTRARTAVTHCSHGASRLYIAQSCIIIVNYSLSSYTLSPRASVIRARVNCARGKEQMSLVFLVCFLNTYLKTDHQRTTLPGGQMCYP